MNRRDFLIGGLAAAAGAAGLAALSSFPERRVAARFAEMPVDERRRSRFPNVVLRTHEGDKVRFYDDLIRDKTVLVNFFYTSCVAEALCPMTTANLLKVQEMLGDRAGREIFFYSITLAPEHDVPDVLRLYARAFGVKPGWLFLTGRAPDIERLRQSLGFVHPDPEKDRDPSEHLGMVRYGIEPLERWASCPCLSSPEAMVQYLAWMDPKGARPDPWPPRRQGGASA